MCTTPDEYIAALPESRQLPLLALRQTLLEHLPQGFIETMAHGMIAYVVPLQRYPDGYHCNPAQPLPFVSLAAQKNHLALYHMGLYADPALLAWFTAAYAQEVKTKLDMGKSCLRFKKTSELPLALIGQLASKISVNQWITLYETQLKA